jgi:hypothetical protein
MENKTGRNFSRNANPDYKKVRRDVFTLVEQLIASNTILTGSLQHNEMLQKKCLARIQDLKAKIDDLEKQLSEQDALEIILREKIQQLEDKEGVLSERMMSVNHLQDQIDYLKSAKINDGFNDAKINTDKIRKKRRAN